MRCLWEWLGTACLFGCGLGGSYDTTVFTSSFQKFILKSQVLTTVVSPQWRYLRERTSYAIFPT